MILRATVLLGLFGLSACGGGTTVSSAANQSLNGTGGLETEIGIEDLQAVLAEASLEFFDNGPVAFNIQDLRYQLDILPNDKLRIVGEGIEVDLTETSPGLFETQDGEGFILLGAPAEYFMPAVLGVIDPDSSNISLFPGTAGHLTNVANLPAGGANVTYQITSTLARLSGDAPTEVADGTGSISLDFANPGAATGQIDYQSAQATSPLLGGPDGAFSVQIVNVDITGNSVSAILSTDAADLSSTDVTSIGVDGGVFGPSAEEIGAALRAEGTSSIDSSGILIYGVLNGQKTP